MEIILKLLLVVALLVLTAEALPKGLIYATAPGEPENIHYIQSKPSEKKDCQKSGGKKTCHKAEIIKVPLRNRSADCPKNHKKDSKGRCRPVWN